MAYYSRTIITLLLIARIDLQPFKSAGTVDHSQMDMLVEEGTGVVASLLTLILFMAVGTMPPFNHHYQRLVVDTGQKIMEGISQHFMVDTGLHLMGDISQLMVVDTDLLVVVDTDQFMVVEGIVSFIKLFGRLDVDISLHQFDFVDRIIIMVGHLNIIIVMVVIIKELRNALLLGTHFSNLNLL